MKIKYIVALFVTLIFTGCGSSGGGSSSGSATATSPSSSSSYTDVVVERGPVIGAYVVDDSGNRAINIGSGTYRFYSAITHPISVYGGYIDINRDGTIDLSDTKLTLPLVVSEQNRYKITILTTLSALSELKNELMSSYGLSEEDIYTLTPSNSLKVAAISDAVFRYCIENNTTVQNINLTALQSIKGTIDSTISSYENESGEISTIVKNREISLIDELNITLQDLGISLDSVQTDITQSSTQTRDPSSIADSMPIYELSADDKSGLLFMYQEEKVARDVYNYLYNKWNLRVFSNIAKSEQTHMDAVKSLLQKYNLTIPSDDVGVFELEELQSLYNTLITSGSVSANEALKVGKLVEETDIADLQSRISTAAEDIKLVYQELLNGSYNHLNAFSKQIR